MHKLHYTAQYWCICRHVSQGSKTWRKVASCCMEMFNSPLPSVSVNNRKWRFLQKFSASENIIIMSSLCWLRYVKF